MKNKENAVGLALQIVYEYPNWGDEHVSDMIATYRESGERPPCTGDELMGLCNIAAQWKKQGKTFQEANTEMLKKK